MPACAKCNVVKATGELRRRPKRPGEYACKDATGCGRRVSSSKLEAKARNLSPAKRRRIELAFEQLEKLAGELGPAFHTEPMALVRVAHRALDGHLNPEAPERTKP
jgi:hypothetical protein